VRTGPCGYRKKGLTARKRKVASQSRNKGQIEIVHVESVGKQGTASTFTDTRSGITRRTKAIKVRTGEQLETIWQGGDYMSTGQAETSSGDAPSLGSEVCSEEDYEPSASRPATHAQGGGGLHGLHADGLWGME